MPSLSTRCPRMPQDLSLILFPDLMHQCIKGMQKQTNKQNKTNNTKPQRANMTHCYTRRSQVYFLLSTRSKLDYEHIILYNNRSILLFCVSNYNNDIEAQIFRGGRAGLSFCLTWILWQPLVACSEYKLA